MKTDKKFSVIISCSTKFHAFAMAEQFEKHGILLKFITTFSSQRNALFQKFVRRIDKEAIPKTKFETNLLIATCIKLFPSNAFFGIIFLISGLHTGYVLLGTLMFSLVGVACPYIA